MRNLETAQGCCPGSVHKHEPLSERQKIRRAILIAASFLPAVFFLLLPFYRPAEVPVFFLLVGRLHPLILHFPIVLIILSLLFEIARHYRWLPISEDVLGAILIAAAFFTFVSVAAGYLLYASGDYSGQLMEKHFWAGVITGAVIFITVPLFFICRNALRFYPVFLGALLMSNVAVAYTSHLGGSITHGPDYLTEYFGLIFMGESTREVKHEDELLVYEDMLAPVFEAKCMSCHNSVRAKGDLLMATHADLMKGGESGKPSVTPGVPDQSELLTRVLLADTAKDHMPPEGKSPLTEKEIALLKFWIQSGATSTQRVGEVKKDPDSRSFIADLVVAVGRYRRRAAIARLKSAELQTELAEAAKDLNIQIRRDSLADENHFTLAVKFPPAHFSNDELSQLSPWFETFSRVSLVSTRIDDDGLYYIGQMKNVRELYLQKNKLDGSGLVYLQKLPGLEVLNLSFTDIDDRAVIDLLGFPKLRVVYLFRTKASKQVIDALRKNKPALMILEEEGPYL